MTPEEARRNLSEAVALFLKTASAHGTLAEVLEEGGYRRVNTDGTSLDKTAAIDPT